MANKYPEHEFSNAISNARVPSDENGVPYPAHVAAEDTTPDSSLETYIDDPSEDEDEDEDKDADAEVDDSGYVRNPKSDYCESCSTTVGVLREAGVRFDRATWVKISSGSLEFSINLAKN